MDALSTLLNNVYLYETKFYCIRACGDWSYSFTRKDSIVFYLVVEGSIYLNTSNEERVVHTGDIVMLPTNHKHVSYALEYNGEDAKPIDPFLKLGKKTQINCSDDSAAAHFILIESKYDPEVTRPLLTALPTILPGFGSNSKNGSELMGMALKILEIASSGDGLGKSALSNRMASIIMIDCLSTHIRNLPDATNSWLIALKDPYLAKALTVMHNEPEGNWTINKLAEVAGMSRSSFAERFKNIVGVPPLTYLIDYRMRLAARYLRLQQNSITKISELVGYASDSTFSQAFKRVYGVSPRRYRQQINKTDISGKDCVDKSAL